MPAPLISNAPNRSGLATATPGTLAIRVGHRRAEARTRTRGRRRPRGRRGTQLSIWPLIEALSELAKIVMSPTSATPIMSAAAVDAVRRGLRTAFSRASVPGIPRHRGSGAPSSRPTGRAITGPSTATPMKSPKTPIPTIWMPPLANSPIRSRIAPRTAMTAPIAVRLPS